MNTSDASSALVPFANTSSAVVPFHGDRVHSAPLPTPASITTIRSDMQSMVKFCSNPVACSTALDQCPAYPLHADVIRAVLEPRKPSDDASRLALVPFQDLVSKCSLPGAGKGVRGASDAFAQTANQLLGHCKVPKVVRYPAWCQGCCEECATVREVAMYKRLQTFIVDALTEWTDNKFARIIEFDIFIAFTWCTHGGLVDGPGPPLLVLQAVDGVSKQGSSPADVLFHVHEMVEHTPPFLNGSIIRLAHDEFVQPLRQPVHPFDRISRGIVTDATLLEVCEKLARMGSGFDMHRLACVGDLGYTNRVTFSQFRITRVMESLTVRWYDITWEGNSKMKRGEDVHDDLVDLLKQVNTEPTKNEQSEECVDGDQWTEFEDEPLDLEAALAEIMSDGTFDSWTHGVTTEIKEIEAEDDAADENEPAVPDDYDKNDVGSGGTNCTRCSIGPVQFCEFLKQLDLKEIIDPAHVKMIFRYSSTDQAAGFHYYVPPNLCNQKMHCSSHKNCTCWVKPRARLNKSPQEVLEKLCTWLSAGRSTSAYQHAVQCRDVKLQLGMKPKDLPHPSKFA